MIHLKISNKYRPKLLIASLVTVTLLYQFQFFLTPDQFSWISIISYAVIPAAAVFVSIMLLLTQRKNNQNVKPVLYLIAGLSSWFVAEQIWTFYEYFFKINPFPSIADIFYLVAYPFIFVFLFSFLNQHKKNITNKMWIFSICISLVFLIPVFIATTNTDENSHLFDIVIAALYPAVDEILLIPVLIGVLLLFKKNDNFFFFALSAVVATVVADVLFFMLTTVGQYYNGHPVDIIYLYSYLLFIFGIYGYNQEQKELFKLQRYDEVRDLSDSDYDRITKIIIPLTICIIIVIISLSLAYLNFVLDLDKEQSKILFSMSIGISILVGIFIVIFLIIGKNLTKLIEIKTKEIQTSKEIINKQLQELQKLDVAKNEFISMVTHELKTPIVPIKSYIELLLSEHFGSLTSEQKEKLQIIQSSTLILQKMILDLLDAQKLELGLSQLNKNTSNISALIKSVIEKLLPEINDRNISIQHDLDEKINIFCDKIRIEQVLTNVIINAIEFCEKNKGKIVISLKQEAPFAKIVVKDNGLGLNKEELTNIFYKFYQVDKSLTRKHGGVGLGLAVCKYIIDNHNGKIWAESEGLWKGTEIHIRLPLA